MAATSLAILDDYVGIASSHFDAFKNLKIDTFPETLNPTTPDGLKELVKRLQPYQVISSMRERTPFTAELLEQLPNLKLLLTTGMRNLGIDMKAAAEQGIIVTGTKGERSTSPRDNVEQPPPAGYSTVIQHSWALLLACCSRIAEDDRALKTNPQAWQSGLMTSMPGKTLGILGLGKLGVAFAKIGVQAFGMKIISWSENLTQDKADAAAEKAGLPKGTFTAVSKEQLLSKSDFLSLHNVLSDRSRNIIDSQDLQKMKRSAILLNTSRGPLIHESALMNALEHGLIRGFVTDVFWEEPLSPDSPWRKADSWSKSSVVLSPHMGYVNEGTINRWYEEQAEILGLYLKGEEVLNQLN